ncbi:MAG: choice-of-anchor D domain-containing protein [Candidatus Binatia bacterium]
MTYFCPRHSIVHFVSLWTLFFGFGWLWFLSSTAAWAQGQLETPTPGSFQSGVGLVRGWVCSATGVDIEFDGRLSIPAVYGEARDDTRSTCGDSNNGFSLQINWNDLGEGTHTIRAVAGQTVIGQATVTVATLGQTFLRGVDGEFPLAFPTASETTRLRWQESRQQFTLSSGGTAATGGGNPRADAKLEDPSPGSFQSGIGVIRGWICDATRVEVEVDNRGLVPAVYGEPRADTQGICGDNDNGFSTQVNWNDIGDGPHTVRVLADGAEFAQATFSVVTLGLGSFPLGLAGEFTLSDFPLTGMHTGVTWQESQQNFVVSGARYSGIDAGLCTTKQGQATDANGGTATIVLMNPCLISGNQTRATVQVPDTAATLASALRTDRGTARAQEDPNGNGFFLCATSLAFQQGEQNFSAESFRVLDSAGEEVCRQLSPGTSLDIIIEADAQSDLNFNSAFTVLYENQIVVIFEPSTPPPGNPQLSVDPSQLVFDATLSGQQGQTFTLTNGGGGTLTGGMTLIASGSGNNVFSLLSNPTFSLGAGQSTAITVLFNSGGTEPPPSGSVRISTNANAKTVKLQSSVEVPPPGEPPLLCVEPLEVNFGSVLVNTTSEATIAIRNCGGETLTGSVRVAAPFGIVSGGTFTLQADESQVTTLSFSPTASMSFSSTATVSSNSNSVLVFLAGQGVSQDSAEGQLCITPTTLDFGSTCSPVDKTFTVTNCRGTRTINITVGFQLGSDPEFSLLSGGGAASLAPGQSLPVTVRFRPSNVFGSRIGVVHVDDFSFSFPLAVNLTGASAGHCP